MVTYHAPYDKPLDCKDIFRGMPAPRLHRRGLKRRPNSLLRTRRPWIVFISYLTSPLAPTQNESAQIAVPEEAP